MVLINTVNEIFEVIARTVYQKLSVIKLRTTLYKNNAHITMFAKFIFATREHFNSVKCRNLRISVGLVQKCITYLLFLGIFLL